MMMLLLLQLVNVTRNLTKWWYLRVFMVCCASRMVISLQGVQMQLPQSLSADVAAASGSSAAQQHVKLWVHEVRAKSPQTHTHAHRDTQNTT